MIHSSTVKLSLLLEAAGEEALTVRVVCDSVKGIDVTQEMKVHVTGDEEELKNAELKGVEVKDAVDEELNDSEFDDDDIEYDEYLANWCVCASLNCSVGRYSSMEIEQERNVLSQTTYVSYYRFLVMQV